MAHTIYLQFNVIIKNGFAFVILKNSPAVLFCHQEYYLTILLMLNFTFQHSQAHPS